MVNIATLISTSALPPPGALKISQLCEFQGVLIQWFMSADACWGALLRDFTKAQAQRPDMEFSPVAAEAPANPFAEMNNIIVTTEIGFSVDTEVSAMNPVSTDGDQTSMSSFSSTSNFPGPSKTTGPSPITAPPIRAATPKQDKDKAVEHRRSLYETSDYRATAFAGTSSLPAIMSSPRTRRTITHVTEGNEAAMSYLKVAMLMFIAMFMIWVPSTVNRLHSFVHKGTPNFVLNLASVIVLPLQGAWAATIYAYTSRSETKRAYAAGMAWLTSRKVKIEHDARPAAGPKDTMTTCRGTRDSHADVEFEDMVEHRERVGRDESVPRDSVVETLTV
ncbi:hypothetical protein J1614_007725 [Plenodomus biglobosus]|nr:hypothetical protein J1614_007725 [Plenodomus biglobosus]